MPSVVSTIFRYHPKPSPEGSGGGIGQSKPKKRLSRFLRSSEKQTKTHGVEDKKTAKPYRASTRNVPELPSLPIYQSFTAGKHLSLPTNHGLQAEERAETPRLSHNGQTERPELSPGAADKPPVHGRATELARFYQGLLPDIESIYDKGPSCVAENSQETSPPGETVPAHGDRDNPVNVPRCFPMTPRHNGWPALQASAVSSSTAAVNISTNGHSQGHGKVHSQPASNASTPAKAQQDPPTKDGNWPLPCPMHESVPESAQPPTPPPELTPRDRRRSLRLSQHISGDSGTLGLQICTKMLIDQLNKTLAVVESETGNAEAESTRSLEILLLIEAYESVLENCQRELVVLIGKEEEEDEGRNSRILDLERATQVLDHWLDTLYALYEQPLSGHGADI